MLPEPTLRLEILGPLRLWRGDVELDAGPRQQAYLLAVLLAREGRPITADELVDLIWGESAPATALNVVHKYVGILRRLLEPGLPARASGSFLLRRGDAYLFDAGPGLVDLAAFRERVAAAQAAVGPNRREVALENYAEAIALWNGPAGDGLTHRPGGEALFADLNRGFVDACVAAAGLAVPLGRPERILRAVHRAAAMAPLHEPVQAALIEVLAAAGEQAAALDAYRAVRSRLADDLGIDPGPALQDAFRRLTDGPAAGPWELVGRSAELAALRATEGPVVVTGEPGSGKTRLLEEAAAEAARAGRRVVWGRCLDGDGTPSMWPWVQVAGAIVPALPDEIRQDLLDRGIGALVEPRSGALAGPDDGTRFRLFEEVVAVVARAAARRPLLLVIDDLQWADAGSIQLFGHLSARLPAGATLIGAMRDRAPAPGAELSRMLAVASRAPGHQRIQVGPLDVAEVAAMVRLETGDSPGPQAAAVIHARTGGNPFFVRELSRLTAGGADPVDVPSTVRDVVLDRIAALDDGARNLLETAAFVGRDVNLGVLAAAAGLDVQTCLDHLAPLAELGLVEPVDGDPYSYRFTHDLVREAVGESVSPRRVPGLHLRIADALDRDPAGGPVVERLAYHLWAAGPLADPRRTAEALAAAGRRAADKSAFETAERHLRSAVHTARTARLYELELSALSALIVIVGRRAGYGGSTAELLERAAELADDLGRDAQAADLLAARTIGATHTLQAVRSRLARRLHDRGARSADPVVRAYGLQVWGQHQLYDVGDVGEALRCLSEGNTASSTTGDPLRYDLAYFWSVTEAMALALHGAVDDARQRFEDLMRAAGEDLYQQSICAHFAGMSAAAAGDAAWALRVTGRWIDPDPGRTFVAVHYTRLEWLWARALLGDDPAGAAEDAEKILVTVLSDPPQWGAAFFYGLYAEMSLAAGRIDQAGAALDRAGEFFESHGPRHAEGLLLLLRARLLRARGEAVAVVRAAARTARDVSAGQRAHLFVRRAEDLLVSLS
ncbi:BTAD domain-containing putative transcriptional regulator [Actinoplanes sp. NBRC 101535]|uniref:BTAD domain-containing putative transcriptional regulator n=1 Tax=Actinoplanes sp. NBRC 101535 TaxID=3032196 RepID=UPI0024A4B06C|nr:BTAD domain-containing putative transcriptional regulator [Actinoplanes sp. NBRC 101535]GLY02454.1 hypothetical protein Acsp01_28330 [Actinoplanes sp. NBRC 101535]